MANDMAKDLIRKVGESRHSFQMSEIDVSSLTEDSWMMEEDERERS